jgi:general stress protein CsbA
MNTSSARPAESPATTSHLSIPSQQPALPSLLRVSKARARAELVSFLRTREATLFTLLFPVVLLLLFGIIFGNEDVAGVKYSQVMVAGILASGVASTSFMSTAIGVAIEHAICRVLSRQSCTGCHHLSHQHGVDVVDRSAGIRCRSAHFGE